MAGEWGESSSPKNKPPLSVASGDFGHLGFSIIKPGKSVAVTYPDGHSDMVSWQTAHDMQKGIRDATSQRGR